ncbi:nesprin-2 isoform X7 [Oncorhynchus keta]|uniref:nesprin-2 isoform X7 n=1 Tax=Oncorhynchus keta TaxID=8018 RepID=UPI00227A64C8|nr:nesprin-2 isoform X7 [Oncorhynchus keta]
MVHSEIYSKAKAMARSRLEKAKFRLQENIQEAIVLFSDREMSDWQAKRKERALGALRPAILEEFLGAAEGLGALCSGAQLQAVKLLSLSVRSQWEAVHSEMTAFLPLLWSEINGVRSLNPTVMRCDIYTTNTERDATDPEPVYRQQACLPSEGSATLRGAECLEALRELCETLAPESSPITAAVQRRESGGGQGSILPQLQHGATVPPQDSRGCEPGDHSLLSETGQQAGPQKQSQELPQKQAGHRSQALEDQNQTQLRQDRPLQVQGLPLQTPGHPLPVQDRPLHVQGRLLQVQGGRLMHVQKSHQQGPNHTQVIVRGDSVETEQQAPERTVIPAADTTPPQEEGLSTQEVVERYRASRSAFHSQLQRNRQSLEREFQPEPVTTSALHSHIKELQALKQETEVLWFEFELQSSQVSQQQSAEGGGLEGDSERAKLLQQWRGQQICLQTRMASLETTVELMESADSQISLISDQLDRITRQPIAISAYGMTDPWTVADFKEMDQRLHAELKCVSGQTSGGEALDPSMPPPQWHRLHQLRQTLKRVRSAAGALDCFLAQIREADAGIQAALVPLDHWQHGDGATRARGRHSGLLSIRQSMRKYGEEAGSVDGLLEAAGMELTMEGAAVTCRDTVAALSRRLDEADLVLGRSGIGRGQKQKEEELSLKGRGKGAGPDMQRRGLEQKEEDAFQRKRGQEQGVGPKAQRRREDEELSGLRRKGQVEGKEGEEKRSSGQRRMALLVVLREIQRAVEQQGLKEPTLPAVQHRMRALADLEGRLAALRSELQSLEVADRGAAQTTSNPERGGATQELETLWEETHRAITERLDRCGGLTELLKRFQMVHSRLSSTLQRAERTISEQASYMGKDNLQRLLTKVHSTKAELSGLGEGVEEMRGICKQLQSQLRQILDCPETPFEGEADTLMDRWLDVTERTDSHLDNLRMGLDLWDGLLQLGGEVESWTSHKMAHLVQSHPFHSEQEVTAMQEEIRVQEESVGRFHRRASEIQVLLQSKEPPLELQVIETQMRKKMEQVKELFSDLEDVYRHLVVAKGQVAAKMAECHSSLQGIQDSLDTLSAADGPKLLTQIQELSAQLQTQEKQAEGLLEELHLMTSVASPQSLQSLAADGVRLHELVCAARQHISEMRVQAQKDIKALHSLQEEFARLQEWLQAAVLKVDKGEELSRVQEEVVEHSKHTEALSGHIATLHGSTLKHSPLLKESEQLLERCCSLHTHLLSSKENQSSLTSHTQAFQTLAQDTQAWVRVLQQQADSLATGAPCIHSQAEQRLQAAETVLSAKAEGESRMEKLKEAGHRLAHRPGLGESLKLDVMQTVSYTEVHWGAVLQSADQHRSLLHGEPELSSSLLVQRQQAWSRVNQLQHQTTQLSLFFPWPGLAQHRQAAQQARALLDQATALGPAFSALGAQRKELAQRTKEPNWEDPSWATLEDCQPALVKKLHGMCVSLEGGVRNEDRCGQLMQECRHTLNSLQERMLGIESQPRDSSFLETDTGAVEALQEAVGHMEKDFVELETLKDILLASCTAKGQATLSQEVKDLQDQKEELERGVSWLAQLQAEEQVARRDQRIREEVDNLQRALQGSADRLGDDPETTEGFTDIRQLQQRWHVLQDCDQSLRKLAAQLHHLEKAVGSEDTYGEFQNNVTLAVDSVAKDLDSLCFSLHERMQLFSGGTALRMSGAICELQQWNQAAQSNPRKSVQATLNNGKQLQGTLREALSQLDFLLDCVGRERVEQFERRAGQALSNSAALLTALAQSQVSLVSTEVDGDNKIPSNTPGKAPSCSEASLLSQPVEEVTPGGIKPLQANIDSTKDPEKEQAESRVMSDTEQRAEDKEYGRDSLKDWSIQPAERMVTGMEDGESQIHSPMGETLTQTPITSVDISATVVVPETPGTSQCGATVTEITPHHIEPMDQEGTSSPTPHKVFTIVLDTDLERQQLDGMSMANALQSRPGYDGNNDIVHTDSPQHGDSEIPATESHDYANTAVVCSGSVGGGQESSVPDKGAQLTYTFAVVKQSDQAKQDLTEPPQKVATIFLNTAVAPAGKVLVQEAETLHREVTSLNKAELGIKSSVGRGTDPQTDPATHLMLHPERKQLETHARPTDKSQSDNKTQRTESRDCTETKKVFTIVLDMEQPPSQSKDIQTREPPCGNGSDTFSSGDFPSKLTDSSVTGNTKNTDGGRRVKSKHRGRRRADFRNSASKGPKVKSSKGPSASKNTESEWEQSQGPKTKGLKSKGPESGLTESKSAELAHTESESQRHTDNSEKTEPGSVDDDVDTDTKDARQTEMTASQIAVNTGASDITCTADSKDNRQTVSKDTGNIDTDMLQVNDLTQTDVSQTDATRDNTQLSCAPSPAYVATEMEPREGTERTAPQEQMQGGSEVKRRTSVQTGGLLSDAMAKEERVGGAVCPEVPCHRSTMQGILSKVQGLVERKDIITGGQWMDAAWYLQPSPRKPEIQIGRTVLRVLGCRYQPAQLNLANMARQLAEAEDCRRYVLEQVAAINHVVSDPEDATNLEGRWSAALLDASATVQVKEAQLHLVTQYHRQTQAIRSILERWTSDMDELQLDTRSSALQAEKLHTLLCNIEQQKGMMGELLEVCFQVSAHLSEVEGSGALLAQLGDLQEEWRLLEGTGNRGLRYASIGSSQSSILLQKAEQLHCKLETLQKSITLLQSSQLQHDTHKALELTFITADLKAFNQQYLHLLGLSEDFTQFSLGQKEKEDVECTLQSLSSLLTSTQRLLSAQSYSIAKPSLAKIIKQMQDLIIWAKQAENHISAGENVALFPEEARLQIASMRKLQSEILARRSRVHYKVEDLKELMSDEGEIDKVLSSMKTLKDLYETVSDNSARILKEMEAVLEEREKMLVQISKVNTWLAVAHHEREVTTDVENVSKDTIPDLESKLQFHMGAIKEAERQLAVTDALLEICMEVSSGLSPAESHFLVNRLTGLRTEVDRMVAHEKAAQWELEELLHTRTSSAEELAAVQVSVQQIWADLERQRFPVTKDSLSAIEPLTHMLLEHQCQIQELQYCQEDQKSALLRTIGELQEKVKTLHHHALEHEKYLTYRQRMEDSREVAKERAQCSKDKRVSVGERFSLCQALLVELPLVKTQCQDASDQLEAIAQDLHLSDRMLLLSERQRIRRTVENLASWELAITDDVKNLEGKLLEGLKFCTELPAMMDLLQQVRQELTEFDPVKPDVRAVNIALRRCWVIWRNVESVMRVLEALRQREQVEMSQCGELHTLRNDIVQKCHAYMENLSHAREALKDYHWAAQGVVTFLLEAEAMFLAPPGGFVDCTEEQWHTQEPQASLWESLQAQISHLLELAPQQACLSFPQSEQLHIQVLSHLLVERATLEAQVELRTEALQRCADRQSRHKKCHEDVWHILKKNESRLSDCATQEVTSYANCADQQDRAKTLSEEVLSIAGKLEELRVVCPLWGCCVGSEGAQGALWRRWAALRCGISLLRSRLEQRGAEWRDITKSMARCSSALDKLQGELSDPTAVCSGQGAPMVLLEQMEQHQAGIEREQRILASLELRLSQILGVSSPQEAASPVPVCQRLRDMQERFRSLREQSMLVRSAALSEEQERERLQEQIGEVEQRMATLLSILVSHPSTRQLKEVRVELGSLRARLQSIMECVGTKYATVTPPEVERQLQEVTGSLQDMEEKVGQALEKSSPLNRLSSRMGEIRVGLEEVQTLLQRKSSSVSEAEHVLKFVWDQLDQWHGRLALLEGEVQEAAEEEPEQAQLLMDQITQPLQLYQDTAQKAEQRTAFLRKIPACLQEYNDIIHRAGCWLEESQSWLDAPGTYTTARSLQSQTNTLQMVLDDSERIRATLVGFGPVLVEISAVCHTTAMEDKLVQTERQVTAMQHNIMGPLDQLLHVTPEVDAIEAEVKTMEKNVTKIRAILSSTDTLDISLEEHLHNRQVILANIQSMQRTVGEIEGCKAELGLPQGAEETLSAFPRAVLLLQPLQELEQLTQEQSRALEGNMREVREAEGVIPSCNVCVTTEPSALILISSHQRNTGPPRITGHQEDASEACLSEEEEEYEDEDHHSSSSDTLTCSFPEDPDETLSHQELAESVATTTHWLQDSDAMSEAHIGAFTKDGRWDLLHTRLSEKLNILRNIQEEDLHAATGSRAEGTGGGFGGLREIEVCAASLRQLRHRASGLSSANSKEGGYPMLDRELYTALCGVEHSLETLTGLLPSPSITTVEDSQLRLLQMECLSVELPALSEELNHLRSGINPDQLSEAPETTAQCVTCLQGCFQTAQSALTSSLSRLHTELGHYQAGTEQQESHVCVYDDFERGQSDPFTHIKDVPMLEYVVGRCPEDAVELQRVSQALLQGLASLVELGRERLAGSQDHPPHSRTQLQTLLSRHKKLYQVMESQLALVQRLFQCEPQGGLVGQEDEQVRLEQQVTTLQQHALEQGATMHRRLQVWTQWEEGCVQLGRQLEELEALIPCEDLVKEEEGLLQERLDTCQRVLALLEECRPALGSVLNQGKALQAWGCSTGVGGTGGVLELRWRAVRSKAEQESQRSRDIRDNWTRFHNVSVSLTGWIGSVKERLKTWRSLPDATPQNEELTRTYLIQLLEFSVELETRSAEKASALRAGTLLLQLKEADAPGLRRQLAQLEQTWTEVTSALPIAQERLHQLLLEKWPPCQVLSGLEAWVKDKEARLEDQGQATIKACHDADQLRHIIQYYQGCQAGNASGQLTLDFLCQSEPQSVAASDNSVSCSEERTLFAERMGALNLSWLLLEGKLGSQVHQAEELFRICAEREKRLRRVLSWAAGLRERLREWQRPVSQTQTYKALQEWEAVEEKLKDVCVEVEDLVRDTWSADTVTQVCTDLNQQVGSLRPVLQRVLVQWGQFEKELGDVSFYTTKLRCGLEHSSGPFLSYHQVKRHVEQLQCLQEEAGMVAEMWTALDQSYAGLSDTISPGAAQLLIERLEEERTQWKALVQEVDEELLRTGDLLSFWGEYNRLYEQCSVRLQHHQEQWGALLSFLSTPCHSTQDLVDAIKHQQVGFEDVQGSLGEVLEASKPLIGQAEPLVAAIVQSKSMLLSRDLVLLGQALSGKRARLQEDLDQRHTISTSMDSLELQTEALRHMLTSDVCSMDSVKTALMALSHLHPALDDLTEASLSVTLDGLEADRLKSLTRKWAQALYCASHMNRKLQAEAQHSQSLQQKWDSWEGFQEKMEEDLAPDVSGNYSGLREQLAIHQRLRIEVLAGHQLLRGMMVISMRSIEDTPEEKSRPDLTLKLAQMRERWQRIVSVAQQRSSLVQERLGQWRFYTRGVRRLGGLLRDVETLLPSAAQALCTLQQLPCSLEDLGRAEETLAQHNGFYRHTLETGRLLSSMAELQTQAQLQTELQTLQESWDHARELLGERRILLETVVQNWGHFQVRLVDSAHKLDELRDRLKQPLPERLEELQGEEKLTEENEASLELWAGGVKELSTMKTDLSQYILAGDATLLQGQVEQLHCQWEELCLKVSLRRQEIADRLSAWTIFNDKNKELCDWLTQMENKVSHSGDLSLEEMVEKLKKDCMEEINLFSENKSHLKKLGEQLMLASDQAKQAQLHGTLKDARDRWQHLFHHIEARVRKLKETLGMVQQLDKNMSNLRSWLSRIETQLARPVTYNVCHHEEIQRRLAQQQELQRDIEQHTEGVASVLRLCDILLHDQDACGDGENDSIQQTTCSLDQRWKAICAMSLERRLRIEETWRLWCKFLDDYSCFEDWLKLAERTAANPNSDNVPYTVAKEELKKFEGFQRQVQERVTQLELVNNQYRRLARENRTDGASRIKVMVHEGNCRWDTLHRRTAAILRRLKHFTGQREEFEGTRESLLVWLTEMDLQLTNVEHFSETDTQHKMKQLNSFQREITLNTERIDGLIVFGEGLIQRSSPLDAALIEDELEELHSYCQEVFGRVVRFHQRLTQPPVLKEEPELFSGDKPLVGSCELIGRSWLGRSQSQGSAPATPTHLLAPPLECSGRETPVSVCDSIPLEWDHTGDVGGSSSHEEEEVEKKDGTYYSTLSEVEVTESPEDFVKATALSLGADPSVPLRSMAIPESPSWRSPGDPDRESLHLDSPDGLDPSPTHTSTPFKQGYVRLMSECSGSIKSVKRVSLILDDEEQPEEQGLTGLTTADKQSGVIERWELLQAQARSNLLSGLREPCQLTSDLRDITSWLGWVTPELERVQVPETPTSIQDMEARVKQLKEMQKVFAHYKAVMLSLNLGGHELGGCDGPEARELGEGLASMNQGWMLACAGLEEWQDSLRTTVMRCQEFHETLHSLLLWLAHAESRRYAVDIHHPDTPPGMLLEHRNTLTGLQNELRARQSQVGSLQGLWGQLQPAEEEGGEESVEAREKLHVTANKLWTLLRQVAHDLSVVQERLDCGTLSAGLAASEGRGQAEGSQSPSNASQEESTDTTPTSAGRRGEKRDPTPPRSFFYRVLRAAFPLHLLLLLVLVLACLVPLAENDHSCTLSNNFARSFYPMLRYTNGPPPT